MNSPRKYHSASRNRGAAESRKRILEAALDLFTAHGVDEVTIDRIAATAEVSAPLIYATFSSKTGILRALMTDAIFNTRYLAVVGQLEGIEDPVEIMRMTAKVARTIYENEALELGSLRGVSLYSATLRSLEVEFENARFELQRPRLEFLSRQGNLVENRDFAEVRRIMWMYTSRDVYHKLVSESEWSPDRFEQWLSETLIQSLLKIGANSDSID